MCTSLRNDDDDKKHVKSKVNPFAWTVRAVNEAKRQIRIVHLMGWASWIYMARGRGRSFHFTRVDTFTVR